MTTGDFIGGRQMNKIKFFFLDGRLSHHCFYLLARLPAEPVFWCLSMAACFLSF
jgi:hypothetical protein